MTDARESAVVMIFMRALRLRFVGFIVYCEAEVDMRHGVGGGERKRWSCGMRKGIYVEGRWGNDKGARILFAAVRAGNKASDEELMRMKSSNFTVMVY